MNNFKIGKFYWYVCAGIKYPVKILAGKTTGVDETLEEYLVKCHCKECKNNYITGHSDTFPVYHWMLERKLSLLEEVLTGVHNE